MKLILFFTYAIHVSLLCCLGFVTSKKAFYLSFFDSERVDRKVPSWSEGFLDIQMLYLYQSTNTIL